MQKDVELAIPCDSKHSLIHIAAQSGNVKKLLKAVKSQDVNALDSDEKTALHVVCEHGFLSLVQVLVKCKGIEINARDKTQWTPLHYACNTPPTIDEETCKALIQICKILLQQGADPRARTKTTHWSPLHLLVRHPRLKQQKEVISLLIAKGADVNAINQHGQTPMMILSESSEEISKSFAKCLIKYGASVNLTDKNNENCAHFASRSGNLPLLQYLCSLGVHWWHVGNYGNPYSLAKSYAQDSVAQFLEEQLAKSPTPPGYTLNLGEDMQHQQRAKLQREEASLLARLDELAKERKRIELQLQNVQKELQLLNRSSSSSRSTFRLRSPRQTPVIVTPRGDTNQKSHTFFMAGFLSRKTSGSTLRKMQHFYVVLCDDTITVHSAQSSKVLESFKVMESLYRAKKQSKLRFELLTNTKKYSFVTQTEDENDQWVTKIESSYQHYMMLYLRTPREENGRLTGKDPISQLRNIPGNTFCVDCSTEEPEWVSINLGILMCVHCSGCHRELGAHISKVRSLTLDRIPVTCFEFLMKIGNLTANLYWEYLLPPSQKIDSQCSAERRREFITEKYEKRMYIPPQTFLNSVSANIATNASSNHDETQNSNTTSALTESSDAVNNSTIQDDKLTRISNYLQEVENIEQIFSKVSEGSMSRLRHRAQSLDGSAGLDIISPLFRQRSESTY